MQGLPYSGEAGSVLLYAALLLTMGLIISWASPACNNPIFSGATHGLRPMPAVLRTSRIG